MEWSPQHAMKAYLQTLHMCKGDKMVDQQDREQCVVNERRFVCQKDGIIEPQGLELIAALAAGNQAKVIVQVVTSPHGITPLTVALAVAAKQTHSRFICIVPTRDHLAFATTKEQLSLYGLDIHDREHGVVELRGGDPCEQIKDLRNVDFAVIDCDFDSSRLRLFCEKLHVNPEGAIIVVNNNKDGEGGVGFIEQVFKGKKGVEYSVTTLPLGCTGVEAILRIKTIIKKPQTQRRRHKRFLITFDG